MPLSSNRMILYKSFKIRLMCVQRSSLDKCYIVYLKIILLTQVIFVIYLIFCTTLTVNLFCPEKIMKRSLKIVAAFAVNFSIRKRKIIRLHY